MKPSTRKTIETTLALSLGAAALLALSGAAAPPPPPDPPPSASAAPPAPPAPPARSLGDWTPPEDTSAKPTAEEWDKAEPLALLRPNPDCSARVVREWLQVACVDPYSQFMGARVVGGSSENVELSNFKATRGKHSIDGITLTLPVRRGDRRLLSIDRAINVGFRSYTIEEDIEWMISELWLPGDPAPTVTLY